MPVSLHTVVVGTFQQMLPQVDALITKVEDHCKESGTTVSDITECSLSPDMWNFSKQVFECAHHSAGAIECVRKGEFALDSSTVPSDIASMQAEIGKAMDIVNAVKPDELDAVAGRDMHFRAGKFEMPFTVSDFLLSFTLPNFYFHTTTAYSLLRSNGIQVGKMDFLGKMRLKK